MEFLKELFAENALSYDDFVQAVSAKGIQLADVSNGYITKEEHDNEIQKQETANQSEKRDHALDIAIMQAKGKNPKAIKALLDMEKITINEDGKVEGIDLSPIQKTDSYLFDTETVSTSGTGAGGMGKYDKDKGYAQGSVSLSYQTKTLTQDRGRTFQLDAMDVDETNFITAAGSVMGEFQRTKVIPEIDAYRYSTIAKLAISGSKTSDYTPVSTNILSKLLEDLAIVRDICGSTSEIIITMAYPTMTLLSLAKEAPKWVDAGSFAQGSLSTKVKTIDGTPILTVPSTRFKTDFKFYDGESVDQKQGGFDPTDDAKDINWIITARNAPIAISKTDVTRIFDPMTNQKANAWRIDYRKYHDLWITKNALDSIWVSTKPAEAGA